MMNWNKIICLIVGVLCASITYGQDTNNIDTVTVDSTGIQQLHDTVIQVEDIPTEEFNEVDSVKYSAEYQFRDGFYIGRQAFLENKPITIDKILTTVPFTDPKIYDKILSLGGFKAVNDDGTYTYYSNEQVFGFVQNRVFYINLGSLGFVRMTNFGKICKISYGQTPPRIQPTAGVGMNSWGGAGVGVGIQINGGAAQVTEYIFRIEGGPIVEFTPEMLLEMMKDDEILFNAYLGLNKRFRMKEMHAYLTEYNRRNPLYLPIYK